MPRPDRIEGLAIVSADHMIADASGVQPDTLKPEADQRFFYGELAKADAVAHGRHSAEGGPDAARRRRLILTRRVPGIARDPENELAIHWNPGGATLDQAWDALGLRGGILAVIGGTEVVRAVPAARLRHLPPDPVGPCPAAGRPDGVPRNTAADPGNVARPSTD